VGDLKDNFQSESVAIPYAKVVKKQDDVKYKASIMNLQDFSKVFSPNDQNEYSSYHHQ
jgi:hypothetical protein